MMADWAQSQLMTKVSRLYHEQGVTQAEIGRRLNLSQAKVSRLLARARDAGIVRIVVTPPPGLSVDLEDALQSRYGLSDAVVVEDPTTGADPAVDLGTRAAPYLEATLGGSGALGVSSWSATLLAAAQSMGRTPSGLSHVVQLVGGHGDPTTQLKAMRLLTLLAEATGADPVTLPAPGTLASAPARDALIADGAITPVVGRWADLTAALVGIGSVDPSPMLRESGNAWSEDDVRELTETGAIGDICLRFFGASGQPVTSSVDDRVVGIDLDTFGRIPRRIAVAGGAHKVAAIRGALLGGWINVLVTNRATAEQLVD